MRDDGVLIGSVSGGCIEDDLVARRNEFTAPAVLQRYGVTSEEARRFGLPCGGQLEVLIESAPAPAAITALQSKIAQGEIVARQVNLQTAEWTLCPAQATELCRFIDQAFVSIHGPRWRLLIIGASEIGVYLAEMAQALDFQVFVCDPREEYRQIWRVAQSQFVEGMPDDAVVAFKADGHSVIIAVSHDPKLDDMALLEALKTEAFYVGAVGSKKTSDERRRRLLQFDLNNAQVARLHGPVGLSIGSRTPPEIAIAILAELVAMRHRITGIAREHAEACMETKALS